jgi:hypothetical protein
MQWSDGKVTIIDFGKSKTKEEVTKGAPVGMEDVFWQMSTGSDLDSLQKTF